MIPIAVMKLAPHQLEAVPLPQDAADALAAVCRAHADPAVDAEGFCEVLEAWDPVLQCLDEMQRMRWSWELYRYIATAEGVFTVATQHECWHAYLEMVNASNLEGMAKEKRQ